SQMVVEALQPVSLEQARVCLRETVESLVAEGRSTKSAGLKPRLQSKTNGAFDEHALGFPTFRAFLIDAEGAGVVRLHRVSGPDILVLPPEGVQPLSAEPSIIRNDVYVAFVEWRGGRTWVWDREAEKAVPAENDVSSNGLSSRFVAIASIAP